MDHDPIYGQFSGENDDEPWDGWAEYPWSRHVVTHERAPVTRGIRLHCRSICAGASHHTLGHEEN